MDRNTIELVDLTKKYGSHTVVDNLNLTVQKGEIFGLLGPNGAGKSTTILMLMGLTEPDSGSVKVCGINSTRNPVEVKKKVGYLPEDVGFYDDYTGLENLIYTAMLNGLPRNDAREKSKQLLQRVGLSDDAQKKAGKYSRGMRQRLGLADVLIKNPEVIILDEPTLGIDPAGVREFLELIVQLSKEDGLTVLFSSHHLHQVQQVCDRVGLFVKGKLLAEGDLNTLSQKLFANNAFTIKAGISYNPGAGNYKEKQFPKSLLEVLRDIEGVLSVRNSENTFIMECSSDLTPLIARKVIESGANLNFLNKKEYGLDDIYYRYFEGGQNHE
ncbi:MAG: ABC transporter ATP-binding protein [Bacteroidales bacterium]|nr:ABC transporter ATP-binding protein [Bacteroidales bacterium]